MKDNRKKNLKNLIGSIVFLSLALCMLVMASYVLRPTTSGTGRWRMTGFYGEKEESIDVVAIGSSALYRYFHNPYFWEQFKITSYNVATPAQPADVITYMIDEVEKTQSPKLYVIETRRFLKDDFGDDESSVVDAESAGGAANPAEEEEVDFRLLRVTDNMKYSWNRFKVINDRVEEKEGLLAYHLDIIRYHGNWEFLNLDQLKYFDNEKNNSKKGWSNILNIQPYDQLVQDDSLQPEAIAEASEKELVRLLEKCKEEQINVVFVSTPWVAKAEHRRQNLYIQNLIEEHGFLFYDGNTHIEEMGLNYATDFYNKNHVNSWGAEKFTQVFGQFIVDEFGIVPSEYDKDVIKSWKECVKANKVDVANILGEQQ